MEEREKGGTKGVGAAKRVGKMVSSSASPYWVGHHLLLSLFLFAWTLFYCMHSVYILSTGCNLWLPAPVTCY